MRLISLVVGTLCVLLSSCNSTPVKQEATPLVTAAQISAATSLEQLVALRGPLVDKLAGKTKAQMPAEIAALDRVDARIKSMKIAMLNTELEKKRMPSGVVQLKELEGMRDELEANALLPDQKWQDVMSVITKESIKTGELIASLEAKAKAESDTQKQVSLYNDLHKVTGYDTWQTKRDELIQQLIDNIRTAAAAENFDEHFLAKVDLVKKIRGDDAALVDEMIGVDAKVYAKRFFDALGQGEPDTAYGLLKQMSVTDDFPKIKSKLAPTSQKMADYFKALADESVKSPDNLAQSFRWYTQATEVNRMLGLDTAMSTGGLGDQLFAKYEALATQEQAAALAHLYAVKSFEPNRPGLRKAVNAQEERVRNLAVKRISTTDFQSPYKDQDYGDVISSFITQYLFEHVPYDVRIVEREQYEAILRERSLSGDTTSLSSVNLLVSGSVLESKVDSSEVKNKKMMRVEMGAETKPNPNYVSWLEMSTKDRKTVEKPAENIIVPKYENISIGVTRHRKVGIFSVSYRLVEASSGRVVFPDSITVSSEHQDESSEGVEIGEFVVPFKSANLPSDVEILDGLAKQVATEIGTKLVGELKDQEQKYLANAKSFADQRDCVGKVQALGNALMILKLKSMDTSAYAADFKDSGVACFN